MNRKKILYILCALVMLSGLSGCFENIQPAGKTKRTIILYVVANNDLQDYAKTNIKEAMNSLNKDLINDGRVLIYYVYSDSHSKLMEVSIGKEKNDTVVLKSYDYKNSLLPSAMQEVLSDAIEKAPAEEYGLILWSHSMGWIPNSISRLRSVQTDLRGAAENTPMTKWFGTDGSYHINIPDLADVLNNFNFKFVLFDSCFGASIESLYDLRNCADYLIGSPTEVLARGFPYTTIMPLLFEDIIDYQSVCQAYIKFYREDYTTGGNPYPSASISWIDLSQIDSLTNLVRGIVSYTKQSENETSLSTERIQAMENRNPHLFFDFDQCIYEYCPPNDYQSKYQWYNLFLNQLYKTILYKDYTQTVYSVFQNGWFTLNNFSGISTYIPDDELGIEDKVIYDCNRAFYRTNWAQAVGLTDPLDGFSLFP